MVTPYTFGQLGLGAAVSGQPPKSLTRTEALLCKIIQLLSGPGGRTGQLITNGTSGGSRSKWTVLTTIGTTTPLVLVNPDPSRTALILTGDVSNQSVYIANDPTILDESAQLGQGWIIGTSSADWIALYASLHGTLVGDTWYYVDSVGGRPINIVEVW